MIAIIVFAITGAIASLMPGMYAAEWDRHEARQDYLNDVLWHDAETQAETDVRMELWAAEDAMSEGVLAIIDTLERNTRMEDPRESASFGLELTLRCELVEDD